MKPKDAKFAFPSYRVEYVSKIKKDGLKTAKNINKMSGAACFADVLYNTESSSKTQLDIKIKFYKHIDDGNNIKANHTVIPKYIIKDWYRRIKHTFGCKIKLTESKEDNSYFAKVSYHGSRGQIICLLSLIRAVFEVQFQHALFFAYQIMQAHPEYKDYMFYLVTQILVFEKGIYMPTGHTWCLVGMYRKFKDEELKTNLETHTYIHGYEYFNSFTDDTSNLTFRQRSELTTKINNYFQKSGLTDIDNSKIYLSLSDLKSRKTLRSIGETIYNALNNYEKDS